MAGHRRAALVDARWMACVEEKIVQRAVVMILQRIYEVDFSDASYGFRPGRSCHQALSVLGQMISSVRLS